jgi:hypothetical protein
MKSVRDFLDSLISDSYRIISEAGAHPEPESFRQNYVRWTESALHALSFAGLEEYRRKILAADSESSGSQFAASVIAGLLQSAVECLDHGFVGRLRHLLHAEVFSSLASQARGLLQSGHLVPAAVLGRIAIEDWLRDEAEKAGITNFDSEKASKLNDSLKAAGKLTQPKWRLIQSFLDVGNSAAHGKTEQFSDADVTRMLDFIESNCLG